MIDPKNNAVYEQFSRAGFYEIPNMLDADAASKLQQLILTTRSLDQSLFMSEEEWENGPKTHKHTNPGPGYDVLEQLPGATDFVEQNADLRKFLQSVLGPNFVWLNRRVVCRLRPDALPAWLLRSIENKSANTLGAFIHQRYRDITYYYNNDLHQDIIDYSRMPAERKEYRYLTLYVYLHPVTMAEAPVIVMPGTHKLGATPFQHDIVWRESTKDWLYTAPNGDSTTTTTYPILGGTGFTALWHPCLLHGGGGPARGDSRLSLRYLVARDPNVENCLLDEINKTIGGVPYLSNDYTPGANAKKDGFWDMKMSDFLKQL